MTWMTSSLAICAALTLGLSACKSGAEDAPEKEKKAAEKEPVASGEAGGAEASAAGEAKPAGEPAEKPVEKPVETPAEKPAKYEPTPAGIEGTYTSGGVTLLISNASKTEFSVRVSSPASEGEEDACGGLDYKGGAKFDAADPTQATTEFEGTLRFSEGGVHFEPSMEMIGMECMRQIDVEFTRSAT